MSLLAAGTQSLGSGSIPLPIGPTLPVHVADAGAVTVTYYVDPGNTSGAASDSYNTTQAQSQSTPWLTLAKAAASAVNDSEALILGPYTQTVKETISTARTGWVTFKAKSGNAVSLAGALFGANARYIAFEGTSAQGALTGDLVSTKSFDTVAGASKLRLRKIPGTSVTLRATASAACSDVIVEDFTFRPAAGSVGMTLSAGSTTLPISDVTIRRPDVVTDSNDAVHVGNPLRLLVENGDFHDNVRVADPSAHVDCFQDVGPGADVTIRNNKMRDSLVSQGIFASDGAIQRLWIENNLIYGLGGVATYIEIGSSQPDAVILFNTIAGRLRITEGATVLALAGNIVSSLVKDNTGGTATVQNEGYNLAASVSGLTLAGTSVLGSATFQDSVNGDYRLKAGSNGLGLAASSFAERRSPTTDRLGVARPVSAAWDAGSDGRV